MTGSTCWFKHGKGHSVVFLEKTPYSHSASSFDSFLWMGTKFDAGKRIMWCAIFPSRPEKRKTVRVLISVCLPFDTFEFDNLKQCNTKTLKNILIEENWIFKLTFKSCVSINCCSGNLTLMPLITLFTQHNMTRSIDCHFCFTEGMSVDWKYYLTPRVFCLVARK